jgi:thiol:disulfide interchange protein DsbD
MPKALKVFFAAMMFGLTASAAPAPQSIVQWRVTSAPVKSLRPGALFNVTVSGRINPGWHVYALDEPEGGPVATVVGLTDGDPADLLRVDQGTPKMVVDRIFQQETGLFEDNVDFTLHLQWNRGLAAGPHILHVLIRYQSCDDHICLAPHTDTVEVPLRTQR